MFKTAEKLGTERLVALGDEMKVAFDEQLAERQDTPAVAPRKAGAR